MHVFAEREQQIDRQIEKLKAMKTMACPGGGRKLQMQKKQIFRK